MNDATTEILLESYIFALDSVGARFIEMLNHKTKQGLKIKLHLDAVGSQFIKMGPSLKKQLDERIQLKWFHRWSWRRPWQFNIRDHRKLLIVDSNQVFLGGFNIHKQSSLIYFGDLRWRDSHIKIEGEIVEHFRRYFDTQTLVICHFSFGTFFTSISLTDEAHPVIKRVSRAKVASRNIVYLVNIKSIPHVELHFVF
ncbi:phospholipase D-like domain-containing protein [Flavobacterium sp. W21_SRS_FM6]|uniref:phospholipase D-like domain-containing protein n=1 Tax=Flavobacterium sp. W21_SRS_FM6 TaxID=3240268 RepID=UPI003F8E59FA